MLIFAIIIMISAVLYIYYKVAILRTKDELVQVYFNSRARFFLGSFLVFFGINQYLAYQTTIILFISIIFLVLGGMQMMHGYRAAKHYKSEWRRIHPEETMK